MFGRLSSTAFLLILLAGSPAQARPPKNKPNYTPAQQLILASYQLDIEHVRSLLTAGVNPDVRVRISPFAIYPDTGLGANPLKYPGVSIRSVRSYRWTPLLAVAYSRRTLPPQSPKKISTRVMDPKALQDRDKRRVAIARLLINQCAQIDLDDSFGTTPLNVALQNGYVPLSLLLIRAGADPNLKPTHSINGEDLATSVHFATRYPTALQLILKHGASLTVKDETGHAPLDWAAYDYNVESVKQLITAGADVNARDANGVTPLYWVKNSKAIENVDEPRKQIVQLLLDAGAKE